MHTVGAQEGWWWNWSIPPPMAVVSRKPLKYSVRTLFVANGGHCVPLMSVAGYRGSAYMHKDRGSCLSMGPVWDYDEAFGLCCGFPFEVRS